MSSDDSSNSTELLALKDLVQSEGWKLLTAFARREYGAEGYGPAMKAQIAQVGRGPDRAYELAQIVEKFDYASDAVNIVLSFPEQRISQLTPDKKSSRPFDAIRRIAR